MSRHRQARFRTPLVIALFVCLSGCSESAVQNNSSISAPALLAQPDTAGFSTANKPYEFQFPRDHGPHRNYRTEWWYFTGNLSANNQRDFGYQLTFFRNGVTRDAPERTSAWATSEIYLAHFGLTDIASGDFYSFERFSRGAAGLAGASSAPFTVHLDDWQIASTGDQSFPIRLLAREDGIEIELEIEHGKARVLQGDAGLSRKSSTRDNASYYFTLPRMPSRGRITIDSEEFAVEGSSWMDREWSTSVLSKEQEGWDWFAIQLDNGHEIMLFELRRTGGAVDHASGSIVYPNGSSRTLQADEAQIETLSSWTSRRSGATYPSRWSVRLPDESLELDIRPRVHDQEHRGALVYWEGAVEISGSHRGQAVSGVGYVELTGYDPENRRSLR